MALGNKNRIVLQITGPATITGDTNNNVVVGTQPRLPCKAKLDCAYISIREMADSKTGIIRIIANDGSDAQVCDNYTSLLDDALGGEMTLATAYKDKVWSADTKFFAKEEFEATSNVDDLCVTLCFREMEA